MWYAVKLSECRFEPVQLTLDEVWSALQGLLRVNDVLVQAIIGPFDYRDDIREHFQLARNGAHKLTGKSR